jgi:hypothetical protein
VLAGGVAVRSGDEQPASKNRTARDIRTDRVFKIMLAS